MFEIGGLRHRASLFFESESLNLESISCSNEAIVAN